MSDQYTRLKYSDDGQPNFSNWAEESIGEVGEYGKRIVFTRMGQARNRVYTFQCSSPRRRDVLAISANIQGTNG